MLLLVLILVLIAFGLLVVALLTGSVLWAWVSVVVSVVAAVVLLIDWLQRRNAVKAGTEAARVPAAVHPPTRMVEPEPVTEVLPVIPRPGPESGGSAVRAGDTTVQQGARDVQFDPSADSTQTVVMPAVQPSASADRPSGASPETARSGGDSSRSVTETGSARSSSTASASNGKGTPSTDDASPGGTETAVAGAVELNGAEQNAGDRAPVDADEQKPADAGDRTRAAERPSGDGDAGSGEPAAVPARSAEDSADGATGEPSAASSATQADAPTADGTPAVDEAGGPTTDGAAAGTPDRAPEEPAADATTIADAPPTTVSGEPPEEERDPAAVAVVAGLEVEVLVIDEQPRYHLSGCAALTGKPLIPIPAREAVELGFTPCGWCNPDRTLAAQHVASR